eukprot:gene32056-41573_t
MSHSVEVKSKMKNNLKYPSILYLSGLTCTDENVCQKSGIFKILSELQVALIAPDTSPRGAGITGEDDSWDFGTGAGFYVDATNSPWSTNYRMYSYITKELTEVLEAHFPVLDTSKRSIMGHSMGGFGALYLALTQPTLYRSVSAFAPISHPSIVPWGIKAFSGYLGEKNKASWAQYDPTDLIRTMTAESIPYDDILIDVGTADSFMHQLLPDDFKAAADAIGQKVTLRYQEGYDHSYYFISSFIEEHVRFHHSRLAQN